MWESNHSTKSVSKDNNLSRAEQLQTQTQPRSGNMLQLTETRDLENWCCPAPPPFSNDLPEIQAEAQRHETASNGAADNSTSNSHSNNNPRYPERQHYQQNNATLFSASSEDQHSVGEEHDQVNDPEQPPQQQEQQELHINNSYDTQLSSSSSSSSSPATHTPELPRTHKSTPPPSLSLRPRKMGVLERAAQRCARWPKTHFWVAFLGALALSAAAVFFGRLKIDISNVGWPSRGTLIANRQMQLHLVNRNRGNLAKPYTDCLWEDLTTVVQAGWEAVFPGEANDIRERERGCSVDPPPGYNNNNNNNNNQDTDNNTSNSTIDNNSTSRQLQVDETTIATSTALPQGDFWRRHLLEEGGEDDTTFTTMLSSASTANSNHNRKNLTTILDTCDVDRYLSGELFVQNRLWPVFRVKDKSKSALDPPVLKELCEAEEQTQRVLREQGFCQGCSDGSCLPPYSPVLYARFMVPNGFVLDCAELAEAWEPKQKETEERWKECVAYLKDVGTLNWVKDSGPCPAIFAPSLVDDRFLETGRVEYTSSIFVGASDKQPLRQMYKMNDQFGKGSQYLEGAYDTQNFYFLQIYANEIVFRDAGFALGSAVVTTLAMLIHTRSPFLTFVGIVQISLSFPLAFGIYRFIGGLTYFPFLNMVGIFVAFALGADHIFVAVDKWKNARRENPSANTEEIAAMALPSAARAMSMTTTTTAIAFFGSAVCPVANIRLFAIFCGLLIIVDYIVDVVVMFPCLCIYDSYRHQRCCCVDFRRSNSSDENGEQATDGKSGQAQENGTEDRAVQDAETGEWRGMKLNGSALESEDKEVELNLIQRILTGYYNVLHYARWPLFVLCLASIGVCCYFATKLKAPETPTELPLMVDKVEYEKARVWRLELLTHAMMVEAGSTAHFVFGLTPADTGDYNDPYTMTTLELDYSFDPSSPEAQVYMRDYCDNLMATEFAEPVTDDFVCPLGAFNEWLMGQSSLAPESQDEIYIQHCEKASRIPVPQESLHACLSSWAEQVGNQDILAWNGTVRIMTIPYQSRVRFDSPSSMIEDEWHLLEDWTNAESENAPPGVTNSYFSSLDFWWWDTSYRVYQTALTSGLAAIAVTAVVILLSSQSLVMTLFSAVSVVYVLASVTSLMVACGWTLGFLESICYTILIGISADFVIHFSHAYSELPGIVDRQTRTKYALLHLGPSVLAAGVTTLAGASMMLCTIIYFFQIFAFVLFFAIIQAVMGSFIVFLVFTDCVGPSNPTYLYSKLISKVNSAKGKDHDDIPGIAEARTEESNDATTVAEVKAVRLSIAEARTGDEDEGTETQAHNGEGGSWDENDQNSPATSPAHTDHVA